jgi:hypothetical protein
MLDGAVLADCRQQIEQRVLNVGATLTFGLEGVLQMNAARGRAWD